MQVKNILCTVLGMATTAVWAGPVDQSPTKDSLDTRVVLESAPPVCDYRLTDKQEIGTCKKNSYGKSVKITPSVCEEYCECKWHMEASNAFIYCQNYAECNPNDIAKICTKNCSCPNWTDQES
ncbi:hypothetical protein LTS08_006825 [Lithohypha guttulata]|uniref:Uncharacterized protein n=1 Tax=Lithohypha guttulata TaxID=1690604 RepID=A0AAN7TC11_9EURO|nr:hypothetical protein LTR51_001879 [Lithohypha guttulata]KAK5090389.1 hypothetical protein LTR05_000561 [Lithohypha guttulata]KAK5097413.1 hypothetical protein LTS08_006825 [Lithohypha guttulata]